MVFANRNADKCEMHKTESALENDFEIKTDH